jgi:hypothetical protein
MNPDATKWIHVSDHVMCAGFSPCLCNGLAYKTKWNQLIPDYKLIADYYSRTGQNAADYWEQSIGERKLKDCQEFSLKRCLMRS